MSRTLMRAEVEEIPEAAARFLDRARSEVAGAAEALRRLDPVLIATVARGSSDHAATYLKYAVEIAAEIPVASIGPSVASIYGRRPRLAGAACIGISQSGRSPDIVALMQAAEAGGALTLALTNDPASPLAASVGHVLPLHAGPERSVAATKTFVVSVVAGLALLAEWRGDDALRAGLERLPDAFARALGCDWTPLADRLGAAESLYVIGRGPAYAIAGETALKFKETCGLHAESYSAAEVLHGPAAIIGSAFPVLALGADDAALPGLLDTAGRLAGQGAEVFLAAPGMAASATSLPIGPDVHPLLGPLVRIVSVYACVEALARRRGRDPDAPPHLNKVTETR